MKQNKIFSLGALDANLPGSARHLAVGGALVAMLLVSANLFAQTDRNNQFDFALIGDVPYAPVVGTAPSPIYQIYPSPEYNAVIADINAHNKVAFTIHVGDIKAGNTWCVGGNAGKDPVGVANVYTNNLALFNSFANAAVYLPGDNEWTDCHRNNNGFYNPQERLGYLRSLFFTSNLSLGQKPITLTRQSAPVAYPPLAYPQVAYPENVMWRYGNVLFVGINQPGSNNNHQRNDSTSGLYTPKDNAEDEYANRNAANITWINATFDAAAADPNTKAIVIMQQANVFERFLEPGQGYTESGYAGFVSTIRSRTIAFGKPVVLVGGDTHTVRIDKPLTTTLTTSATTPTGPLVVSYPGIAGPPVGTTIGATTVTAATMFSTATGAICSPASSTCVVPNRLTSLAPNPTVTSPNPLFNTTTGASCTTASTTCVGLNRVQNFTRVEVFGSPDVEWVRGIVDPFDPNVFSFAMQTIAGTGHGRDGRTDDDDLQ